MDVNEFARMLDGFKQFMSLASSMLQTTYQSPADVAHDINRLEAIIAATNKSTAIITADIATIAENVTKHATTELFRLDNTNKGGPYVH